MLEKRKRLKIPKILKAAEGEDCTINSIICNHRPETSSFAHLNESWAGKGTGQKADDCAGAIACSDCHDWLDGRKHIEGIEENEKTWYWLRGVCRTMRIMFDKGVIS